MPEGIRIEQLSSFSAIPPSDLDQRRAVVESKFGMSADWPTSWQGQTYLDCGADGRVLTTVGTSGQPSAGHQRTFEAIAERWSTIWPEFRQRITQLMGDYGQAPPNWNDVRVLHLGLPVEPLEEGAEWSIGVVFSSADTVWSLPYSGWEALREKAQAIW
jgi:hypothetical protein